MQQIRGILNLGAVRMPTMLSPAVVLSLCVALTEQQQQLLPSKDRASTQASISDVMENQRRATALHDHTFYHILQCGEPSHTPQAKNKSKTKRIF
jgi:hypothetical protein